MTIIDIENNRVKGPRGWETIIGWLDRFTPLTQETIDFSEERIVKAEAVIEEHTAKLKTVKRNQVGAYKSRITKARQDLERHKSNLEYQRQFVGVNRPEA